ncbi:MAG: Nucleotidyl transferase [Candidatus Amesbacteria bacterium GW2011_GWB1_47_26]|nr:MAG: Nucleotidyl transferase [Candidatus Amesbacteria bacterium GW2011_GWB1_47_26]
MQNKIRIGVIPAAGSGKRLGYLSSLLPKTLFPLYDRPIIHYVVDQMQSIGIEDIYIIVNIYKEKIIEYFKFVQMDLRANIYFIEQKTLNGNGEAILLAEQYTKKEPFMVIYGDDCTVSESLDGMIQNFLKSTAIVMEGVVKEEDLAILRQTCSVKLAKNGRMIEIIEKPENPPHMFRGCGVYLFRPEVFSHIRNTPIHPNGSNVNINDYDELIKASQMLKDHKKASKKLVEVLF